MCIAVEADSRGKRVGSVVVCEVKAPCDICQMSI